MISENGWSYWQDNDGEFGRAWYPAGFTFGNPLTNGEVELGEKTIALPYGVDPNVDPHLAAAVMLRWDRG